MISKQTLKEISKNKLDVSKILFKSDKYDTSLYLVGYAIELALKYKICKILKLDEGFPENKTEFNVYISKSSNDLGTEITNLSEIRNHNLQKLLYYSGQEFAIKSLLLIEWTDVSYWNPELRYKLDFGDKNFNKNILVSVEKIISLIFK